jgi:D-alanyl-D-alanine carboxypeptidase/D-alanyl-D-alanine-endopeptidase (penicillin-binding protein 4)
LLRRWAVPVALTALTAAAGIAGVRTPAAAKPGEPMPAVRAGVLSPRRVPALLHDAVAGAKLHAALDRVLTSDELGAGRNNACLIVTGRNGTLYDRDPDRAFTPASTLKLLTAAAVLLKLDPNSHLTTRVVSLAAPVDGVITGDVYLVGGGDPLLGTPDYAASFKDQPHRITDINALADALVNKAGVRAIRGSVRGDESRYDTQRAVPTWKVAYTTNGDVGPLSALNVNDGFVAWKPKDVPTPVPAGHAAAVLTDLLKARGVTVDGEPAEGKAPTNPHPLASLDSPTMRELVGEMLVHSDNEGAELLAKELGRRFGKVGTTAAGVEVIRKTLTDAGIDMRSVVASDASGLATTDRLDCDVLHSLLSGPTRSALLSAGLSVAGRYGTMFDRFKDDNPAAGRLHGKTGTLEGVVGLAGVMDPVAPAKDGLTFAFLANSLPTPSELRGKRFLEKLGAVLAAYPNAPAAEDLAP